MNLRRKILIGCVLFFSIIINAQEVAKEWSLVDCMEYAVTNNLQIKQQEFGTDEAKLELQGAYANYLPSISANANNAWNSGLSRNPVTNTNERLTLRNSSYNLTANIPIFSGLQNYHQLQVAELRKIANQYNIDTSKDNIRLQIANSYLQIVIQEENLEVLQAQHQITLEQLKRTQQLVEAGNLPKGDVLTLEATSATDLQNIANAENSVLIAKTAMKQLLNIEFDQQFEVQKIEPTFSDLAILEQPVNKVISNVLAERNEVKLAAQNLTISEKQIAISKANFYPTLSAFANASTSELGLSNEAYFRQLDENFGFSYGFSLTVPIFNNLQIRNGVKRSQINRERSSLELEQVKQRLTRDVYQAYLDAKASKKAYEASKLAVTANEQAYEYAKSRYEVGISNSLDFSQSKIVFQNSQVQLIQAKYDLLFRLKLLELYVEGRIE